MNFDTSLYPKEVADKAIEILVTQHKAALKDVGLRLSHARKLMMRGAVLPYSHDWRTNSGTLYDVQSEHTATTYLVDTEARTCNCMDFAQNRKRCKHILATSLTLLARKRIGYIPMIEREQSEVYA